MKPVQKTCFVIIGYGLKTDHITGREIDLEKSYEYIIKPVFEELGFFCFRASDIKHAGAIDVPMYDSILKSDFVVADLSTLNPNVLYELGVRHAVRKNTTIIISEEKLQYPFDLSHILIEKYEHLGKAIDFGEVHRFKKVLSEKVAALLEDPQIDSPLYTFFPDLEVPRFTQKEVDEIKENIKEDGSLSDLMLQAAAARDAREYTSAIGLLQQAKKLNQENVLVQQQLALMTYKSELPNTLEALLKAKELIEELEPKTSTDLETLGLSGAICKRLYEQLDDLIYLEEAIWCYEKGFYIGRDYYNGINLAYLHDVLATVTTHPLEAFASHGQARRIRKKVIEICTEIMQSKSWENRRDRVWIYLTIAEAYFGLGSADDEAQFLQQAEKVMEGTFAKNSYDTQKSKLEKLLKKFQDKYQALINANK